MKHGKDLDALRRRLRHKAEAAGAEVSVATAELRLVLEELGRLLQSSDRLRRQNRRLRLRLQAAGLTEDVSSEDLPESEAGAPVEDGAEGPGVEGDPR
jgi:hypothetical protein